MILKKVYCEVFPMLSYQHAYHAGNFADVLKHTVLCQVLVYLRKKDKPFYFHDTHAGRGFYDLTQPMAQKTGEFHQGIERLWHLENIPEACLPYMNALRSFNDDNKLRYYAGSSLLAQQLMRKHDRLVANELHPQEFQCLEKQAKLRRAAALPRLRVSQDDGFSALKAALPPAEHRGVVLIDPSYELLSDDKAVVQALAEALKRFATGVYLLWYPIVELKRTQKLVAAVKKLPSNELLQVELLLREPDAEGHGMAGSGLLVLNPPWQLDVVLSEALPWLVQQLAADTGHWHLNWLKKSAE